MQVFRTLLATFSVLMFCAVPVSGGEVVLKTGTRLEGKPVPLAALTTNLSQKTQGEWQTYPILMVDGGMKRYFVPARQVLEVNHDALLEKYERFVIPQVRQGGKHTPTSLGMFSAVTPFDEFGRRRVTLNTNQGEINIVQGITEISSQYLKIIGLTHTWEMGLATTSIPYEVLNPILRHATDPANPDDRLAIARFYIEAGLYLQAAAELDSMLVDFPELRERVTELSLSLRQLQAKQLLAELRRRKANGQHQLAYTAAVQFPRKNLDAEVLREVDELLKKHKDDRDKIDLVKILLGEFQAKLDKPEWVKALEPLRAEIQEDLGFESIDRMEAFLTLESDETLPPADKLALAYSGWLLGSENASTNLDAVLRLYQVRHLVLEYLRTDNIQRHGEILQQLATLEGAEPEVLQAMIPQMPMPLETPGIQPGVPFRIEVPGSETQRPVAYWVLLPTEYNEQHTYPLVVTLHPAEYAPEKQLLWWGGTADQPLQSQRRGYIVIAPEYAADKQLKYDYSVDAHAVIIESMRNARMRFNIDSDRVFLSGHGMGGDAAFDLGMSHPDLFAGVIPITGICDGYTKWYWTNTKDLPWYVVAGELDRDSISQNARELNRMMRYGYDIIYAEYAGRGYESYYEEIHHLFDWMDGRERVKNPKDVDMKILRPSDNRFHWIKVDGLPRTVLEADPFTNSPRSRVSPLNLTASIKDGAADYTAIYIRSGAERNTVWLSPTFIDFGKKVQVREGSRLVYSDYVRQDLQVMLEDLRARGDRQNLYWAKLDL